MTIRKATNQDKDQIVTLIHKFDEYYLKNNLFSEEFKEFVDYKNKDTLFIQMAEDFVSNPKYFMFVAEEDDALIGYICGEIQTKEQRILDKEGFIDDWFVEEEYRGQGVGRQLYENLIEEFKNAHCNRVGLKAYAVNKETIDMYHRMGFVDTDIVMAKKLE